MIKFMTKDQFVQTLQNTKDSRKALELLCILDKDIKSQLSERDIASIVMRFFKLFSYSKDIMQSLQDNIASNILSHLNKDDVTTLIEQLIADANANEYIIFHEVIARFIGEEMSFEALGASTIRDIILHSLEPLNTVSDLHGAGANFSNLNEDDIKQLVNFARNRCDLKKFVDILVDGGADDEIIAQLIQEEDARNWEYIMNEQCNIWDNEEFELGRIIGPETNLFGFDISERETTTPYDEMVSQQHKVYDAFSLWFS
jgi:hypothetical protein